jgi:hypothetical protein
MPPRQNTSACKLGIFTSALLGRIHPALTQDITISVTGSVTGSISLKDDRVPVFFGVTESSGISSLFLTHSPNGVPVVIDDFYTGQALAMAPIPLPASGVLLLAGLGGMALTKRRKR